MNVHRSSIQTAQKQGKAKEATPTAAEAGLTRIQAARIKALEDELQEAAKIIKGRSPRASCSTCASISGSSSQAWCTHTAGSEHVPDARPTRHPPAAKDQQLEEAAREAKELRADKAAWAKKQKLLEAQVGGCAACRMTRPRIIMSTVRMPRAP